MSKNMQTLLLVLAALILAAGALARLFMGGQQHAAPPGQSAPAGQSAAPGSAPARPSAPDQGGGSSAPPPPQ